MRYYLDLDPHEDLFRIIGLLIIELLLAFLVYKGSITAEQFMAITSLIVGYFIGRVKGKP